MSRAEELRQAIRQKVLAGDLPKENCHRTWYGPGTGGVCLACQQASDLPGGGTSGRWEWPTCEGLCSPD